MEQLEDPAQRSALRLEYATLGWNGAEAAITIALGVVVVGGLAVAAGQLAPPVTDTDPTDGAAAVVLSLVAQVS